jgi:hypothetical protein
MEVALGDREFGQVVEEAREGAKTVRGLFLHLFWVAAWGIAQWFLVVLLVSGLGWDRLPYDTIGEVGVWVFLAINASAWIILSYSIVRFRRPILWLWWAACATWWLTIFVPYHAGHAAFRGELRQSQADGLRLAQRIEEFRRERGHLPRKLQDVAARDQQRVPDSAFGKPILYRLEGLNQFALVIEAGDKNYCYSSRQPRQGFVQRYFDGSGS